MPDEQVHPVYVLHGHDAFLRDENRREIVSRIVGQADPQTCVVTFDASAEPADVFDELRTLPFLAERRVVIIREADAFVSAHRKALESYLEAPTRTASLILTVLIWRKNTNLAKLVARIGQVRDCSADGKTSLRSWLSGAAKKRDKKLARAAAELLAQWVGGDLAALDGEIEKLSLYVGGRETITPEDVSRLVIASAGPADFALTNAITAGDAEAALRALSGMLVRRGNEFKTIGMIAWHLRRAIQASRAIAAGVPASKAIPPMPYRQRDEFSAFLRRRGLPALEGDFRKLLQADLGMKSGVKPTSALQQLVVALCS